MRRRTVPSPQYFGLSDLLGFQTLADNGVVVAKDGTITLGFYIEPPDAASVSDDMQEYVATRMRESLQVFGSGWTVQIDVCAVPSNDYPPPHASTFPDSLSAAVDAERRGYFMTDGRHFQNVRVLLVSYRHTLEKASKVTESFYTDQITKKPTTFARLLEQVTRTVEQMQDQLGSVIRLHCMGAYEVQDTHGRPWIADALVDYLGYCVTDKAMSRALPPAGNDLDVLLACTDAYTGETPIIGGEYLACVTIEGFPAESHANILARLSTMAFAYRFSQRSILMDAEEAVTVIKRYKNRWRQKTLQPLAMLIGQTATASRELNAQSMADETNVAIGLAQSGTLLYGYHSAVVTLRHADFDTVQERAREVVRQLADCGFTGRIETTNTMDAWLGTLAGDRFHNVRRPLLHTANIADFWPLAGIWTGSAVHPSPMYPKPSPPVMLVDTVGGIVFCLNLHVGDVGMVLIFGPIGKGKSTLLAILILQSLRYPGMQITAFDYKRGLYPTVMGCGGQHFELGGSKTPALCPLNVLDTENDLAFAEDWLERCYELQTGRPFTPEQRRQVRLALERLSHQPYRSISDFVQLVQDKTVQESLRAYTVDGAAGYLLDAREDGIETGHFNVFETIDLMSLPEKTYLPVLLYLFRRFERSLDGLPAMLVLDEAWVALGNPVWRERLRGWLKLLRSKNCAVVISTQSLSDAYRSGLLDVLIESCPTKIFLPNEEALKRGTPETPGPNDLYRAMGLNDNQIEIIRTAIAKRHYYVTSPEGCRLVDLALGPLALAFAGATSEKDAQQVRGLIEAHGDGWVRRFLDLKGVNHARHL